MALAVFPVVAQTTNAQAILGSIQDSSGAVVSKATVSVVNQETNLSRSAVANESGNYVVTKLPIGFYSISAEAPGFQRFVLTKTYA